jgi:Fic family protein
MSKKLKQSDVTSFLMESNAIEGVYGAEALADAEEAWEYAYKNRERMGKKVEYILTIHKKLMGHLNPRIAGKLRDCDVFIGGHRKIFIDGNLLRAQLKEWATDSIDAIETAVEIEKMDPLSKSNLSSTLHILFESLHPFEDGNGRVGRILYNIHRLLLGLPLHIIHEGEEQIEYYQWFRTSKHDDYQEII